MPPAPATRHSPSFVLSRPRGFIARSSTMCDCEHRTTQKPRPIHCAPPSRCALHLAPEQEGVRVVYRRFTYLCRDCLLYIESQQKVERSKDSLSEGCDPQKTSSNTCSSVSCRPLLPSIFWILQQFPRLLILDLSKPTRFRPSYDCPKLIPQGFSVFDETIPWCGPPRRVELQDTSWEGGGSRV